MNYELTPACPLMLHFRVCSTMYLHMAVDNTPLIQSIGDYIFYRINALRSKLGNCERTLACLPEYALQRILTCRWISHPIAPEYRVCNTLWCEHAPV